MSETSYPHRPYRLNHTDIRTEQVFNELHNDNQQVVSSSVWSKLYADGATLERGIFVKHSSTVSSPSIRIAVGGTTADGGFNLIRQEEVFIPCRQLGDVYYKQGPSAEGTGLNAKFTWRAY